MCWIGANWFRLAVCRLFKFLHVDVQLYGRWADQRKIGNSVYHDESILQSTDCCDSIMMSATADIEVFLDIKVLFYILADDLRYYTICRSSASCFNNSVHTCASAIITKGFHGCDRNRSVEGHCGSMVRVDSSFVLGSLIIYLHCVLAWIQTVTSNPSTQ
jgi:hypothetical protein